MIRFSQFIRVVFPVGAHCQAACSSHRSRTLRQDPPVRSPTHVASVVSFGGPSILYYLVPDVLTIGGHSMASM